MALRGGSRLQAALAELVKKTDTDAKARIGFLEGSTYPDGTPIAEVAAYNEFGTATSPPRPFMRQTIAANQDQWGKLLGAALKMSDYNTQTALGVTGARIVGQVQDQIRALKDPPLKPSTIAAKGFDKPLIDTGDMLRSVDSEVTDD